jgi:hypothetical protein
MGCEVPISSTGQAVGVETCNKHSGWIYTLLAVISFALELQRKINVSNATIDVEGTSQFAVNSNLTVKL